MYRAVLKKGFVFSMIVLGISPLALAGENGPSNNSADGSKMIYLKDSNSVAAFGKIAPEPSLIFNESITVPVGAVTETGPLLLQNGKQVSIKNLNKKAPYCALGGNSFSDSASDRDDSLEKRTFKPGDRVLFQRGMSNRKIDSELIFDEKTERFTGTKPRGGSLEMEFMLRRDFTVSMVDESYVEAGVLKKSRFPSSNDPKQGWDSMHMRCFNLPLDAKVGQIRDILGRNKMKIMPDASEAVNSKLSYDWDFKEKPSKPELNKEEEAEFLAYMNEMLLKLKEMYGVSSLKEMATKMQSANQVKELANGIGKTYEDLAKDANISTTIAK